MEQIKGLLLFVISVVKKSDEFFGVNEVKAYYDRLEKMHGEQYEIKMRE